MTADALAATPSRAATAIPRSVALVTLTTVVIGASNYAMSIAVVHLLPAGEFTRFAAVQGLLLVLGTGSLAAVPWAVARHITHHPDAVGRSNGLHFGLVVSAWQGLAFAAVAAVVGAEIGGPVLAATTAVGAAAICLVSAPIGYFQGLSRYPVLVTLRLIETGVRIATGLGLALLLGEHAALVVLGFPLGAAAAVGFGLSRARDAFPLTPMAAPARRRLLRQAGVLGVIQALLSALAALDTVYAGVARFGENQAAAYQASALLARVPLFFGSAVSITAFTAMVAAGGDAGVAKVLRGCVRSYAWLCVPFLAVAVTVPTELLQLVVPAEYDDAPVLLRLLVIGGVAVGAVNVVTTAHQARLAYRRCVTVLAVAALAQAVVLLVLGRLGDVHAFAVAVSAVAVTTLVAVAVDARRWLGRPYLQLGWDLVAVVLLAAVMVTRHPLWWLLAATALGLLCVRRALRTPSVPSVPTPAHP